MRRHAAVHFAPDQDALVVFGAAGVAFALNWIAWMVHYAPWRIFWYFGLFGVGACIVFPTWYWSMRRHRALEEIGLSLDRWPRALGVGLVLVALTVPWRLGGAATAPVGGLVTLTICMCFAAMFEEIFFRGFLQTRFDAAFGVIPAIALSSIAFSLYHVGYEAYWREPAMLALMAGVGVMLGISFQLTRNVLTTFVLNGPHAVLAFAERDRFFDWFEASLSAAAIAAALAWIAFVASRAPTRQSLRGPSGAWS